MAGTTLAQGSSVTLTVAITDSLLIDSARNAKAVVEAVTGVPGYLNKQVIASHAGGQSVYGPFGAGTVKLTAIGGAIQYMQGTGDVNANANITAIGAPDEFTPTGIYLTPERTPNLLWRTNPPTMGAYQYSGAAAL